MSLPLRHRLLERLLGGYLRAQIDRALRDHLYAHAVHGDASRLHIAPTATVNDALFNVSGGEITVGDWAFFGHSVLILSGEHDITRFGPKRKRAIERQRHDIVIGEGAWIASGAIVLGPCMIGEHAVVAAGSVVTTDNVDPYTVVGGNPARVLRRIPHEPSLDRAPGNPL